MTDSEVIAAHADQVTQLKFQCRDGSWIFVERRTNPGDEAKWAVVRNTLCWTKVGQWEYEPSPNSRSLRLLKQSRYKSLTDALKALVKARAPVDESFDTQMKLLNKAGKKLER